MSAHFFSQICSKILIINLSQYDCSSGSNVIYDSISGINYVINAKAFDYLDN